MLKLTLLTQQSLGLRPLLCSCIPFYKEYSQSRKQEFRLLDNYFLIDGVRKFTEMSTRKRVDNRKRGVTGEDQAGASDVKNEGLIKMKQTKGGTARATKSRKAVKIEVEPETLEVSEGHQDKEEKGSAANQAGSSSLERPKTSPSPSPSKKNKAEPQVEPPDNWEELLKNIKIMRSGKTAAVDTMGCERTADVNQEPKVQRFQTLVSLILSSQTKDQVTYAAVERLKQKGLTVQGMLDIDEGELAGMLNPVGFYRRKATYIKKVASVLREKYGDDIPRTVDDLCALPGVGPKMAYICMNAAWKENAGIGVDTHVHRISNRLKWTGKKGTSTPEKTREALESWLPKEMWQEINILLVGFGQEICLPIGPKCATCLNKDICPSAEIGRKPKK